MGSAELAAKNLSAADLVKTLYRVGLSREPDAAGGAAATAALAAGTPLAGLVAEVTGSPEFAGLTAARCSR